MWGFHWVATRDSTTVRNHVFQAHKIVELEVMLYLLNDKVRRDFGSNGQNSVIKQTSDFIFIEPGVPHEVFNIGDGPRTAFVAALPLMNRTRPSTIPPNVDRRTNQTRRSCPQNSDGHSRMLRGRTQFCVSCIKEAGLIA